MTFHLILRSSGGRRDSHMNLPAWRFLVVKEATETKRAVFDGIGNAPAMP